LRAIAGFGTLLLEQCPGMDPVHKSYLERSNTAAQRMDQLIRDALDYNKVALGNFVLKPVDCRELLQQLVESYPQFQQVGAHISIAGEWTSILGSEALLTQCFSNLLNNALKFVAPSQTPSVRIYAEDLGTRVRICFVDNGIGIDEEDQKKLFQMFQRLNPSYEGTGVGLAIVKKAASRMGGTVGVQSAPGRGSRFWVEFQKVPSPA
jgi:signal transduction histidine kinase